jgi:AraC family transcriptional regulator, regulatory protein of adaptative response / DNA-3-methyladenine glycosylase II
VPAGPWTTTTLRLAFRPPLCPDNLFGHLVATAVPGVEEWREGAYRCTLRLPGGPGIATLRPEADPRIHAVACTLTLTDGSDAERAVAACRRMLDLDADPSAVDPHLARDPVLAPLVAAAPGRRVPGTAHPEEFALRAVLGQQVSTAAARTHAARLVARYGEPVIDVHGGLTHLFPTPAALVAVDPSTLALPRARQDAFTGLVRALAAGRIDLSPGGDPAAAVSALAALPGIGPWTVGTIAMRALGDRDAFLPGDLGVRLAARRLGLPSAPGALTGRAEIWRPWRAYAIQHLWATGDHDVNRMPT